MPGLLPTSARELGERAHDAGAPLPAEAATGGIDGATDSDFTRNTSLGSESLVAIRKVMMGEVCASSSASTVGVDEPEPGLGAPAPRWHRALSLARRRVSVLDWPLHLTYRSTLQDLGAALTVCVLSVPESMSYANIAGLPYVYGLYIACLAPLIYALFGGARQLAVGPTAMLSLVLRAGLHGQLDEEQCPASFAGGVLLPDVDQSQACPEAYFKMILLASFVSGLVLLVACLFRAGFLVTFLGHPVVSGFTTGAAIIIGLSQLKYFLGYHLPHSNSAISIIIAMLKDIHLLKPAPMLLGLTWLAFLLGTKKLAAKDVRFRFLLPLGPLVGCVVGILLVWQVPSLREQHHVAFVGPIPGGLPPVSVQKLAFQWKDVNKVMNTAVSGALISFMESIAIAQALAAQHGYSVDPSQELCALGLTNVFCSLFSGYAATGSFSRTAVANSSGAQTQLAGVVVSVCIMLVLLFVAPAFYFLPMFVLAAIVIKSVCNLVQYDVAIQLWKVKRWDFVLWLVACVGTLILGPLEGIGIAVALSVLVVIYESARPQLAILWRVPGTAVYRTREEECRGESVPGLLIVRVGASLYFANTAYVKRVLLKHVEEASAKDPVHSIVLDMSSVHTVDSTAVHLLSDLVTDFEARRVRTAFAVVGSRVMRTLGRAEFPALLGEGMFFPSVADAVNGCLRIGSSFGSSPGAGKLVRFETPLEVGISNCMHHRYTQVNIFMPHPFSGFVKLISTVFSAYGCTVVDAQVEHTHHTFRIFKAGGKLSDIEVDELRARLLAELSDVNRSPGAQRPDAEATANEAPEEDLNPTSVASPNPTFTAPASMDLAELEEGLATERVRLAAAAERARSLEEEIARRHAQATGA